MILLSGDSLEYVTSLFKAMSMGYVCKFDKERNICIWSRKPRGCSLPRSSSLVLQTVYHEKSLFYAEIQAWRAKNLWFSLKKYYFLSRLQLYSISVSMPSIPPTGVAAKATLKNFDYIYVYILSETSTIWILMVSNIGAKDSNKITS